MSYQMAPVFAVPMAVASLPDAEAGPLNAELRELFLARSADDRYKNPHPFTQRNEEALFESNFRLFDWPQACVQKLREFCMANVYRTIRDLSGYDLDTLKRLHMAHEAWFHVTRKGGWFGAHNHPMHTWSGVYCVCQEGDEADPHSGQFNLLNPHASNTMYIDMASVNWKPPYSMAHRVFRLRPGELLIFPSWLLHEVMPYSGDGVRITVAFNCRFMLAGAKPDDVPIG